MHGVPQDGRRNAGARRSRTSNARAEIGPWHCPYNHCGIGYERGREAPVPFRRCLGIDHYASGLDMVEIEIGILDRLCLGRRLIGWPATRREVNGWGRQRNAERCGIDSASTPTKSRWKTRSTVSCIRILRHLALIASVFLLAACGSSGRDASGSPAGTPAAPLSTTIHTPRVL